MASNHVSYWDPILIAAKLNRKVHFMAKAEFFENRLMAYFFRGINAFPVKRGAADRHAIRHAMALLEQGEVVGIFPEGTRNLNDEALKAQLGVAIIASKTGCPVLPVACVGKRFSRRFQPSELRVGEQMDMEQYRDQAVNSQCLESISAEILDKINQLL